MVCTGSFGTLGGFVNDGDTGFFQSISWTGIGPTTVLVNGPVMSFWQAGVLSFTLSSLSVDTLESDFLSLVGEGTVSGVPGRGPLPALFDLTTNFGGDFTYDLIDTHTQTFITPDGGSALASWWLGCLA
jgi:hypothetical protein